MEVVYRHRNISMLMLVSLCIFITTAACQRSEELPPNNQPGMLPTYSQDERRILNSFLIIPDLPDGWFRDYFDTEVVEGDTVHAQEFRLLEAIDQEPYLDYIFVSQEIILYTDEAQAREGYQKWLQPRLVLEKRVPSEINFRSRADESRVGCTYGTQPENVCTAIARYDRLVSLLRAKVWDEDDAEQWFTWADFEQVLEAMDRRALEAAGR